MTTKQQRQVCRALQKLQIARRLVKEAEEVMRQVVKKDEHATRVGGSR